MYVLDWEQRRAELFAGTLVVNMHTLACHAMHELEQERVQGKASRYLGTLADWRYCRFSVPVIMFCGLSAHVGRQKNTRHKNMTERHLDMSAASTLIPHRQSNTMFLPFALRVWMGHRGGRRILVETVATRMARCRTSTVAI